MFTAPEEILEGSRRDDIFKLKSLILTILSSEDFLSICVIFVGFREFNLE